MGRTITLDPDVAERLEAEAARTRRTVDEVGNERLRERLPAARSAGQPFRVRARNLGVPKIDLSCTGRALATLDEMEELERK